MNNTINIPRDKLQAALTMLEQYLVREDAEYHLGRTLEEIEKAGSLPEEIVELRAMLAQPANAPAVSVEPDEWAECQRICDLPDVDASLIGLTEDPTNDNAVCLVRSVRRATLSRIVPASPAVDDNERIGWISKAGLKALRKGASVTIHINSCGKFDRPIYLGAKAASPAATVPEEREDSPAVQGAWNKFNALVSDGPDSRFPGMAKAFESSYGQARNDKDWRNETSIWASAWKAAWQARAALAAAPSPEGEGK